MLIQIKGENRVASHEKGDLLILNIEGFISHSDDLSAYLNRIYESQKPEL